jgi:proteasome lid subunit RPN8/RPN11
MSPRALLFEEVQRQLVAWSEAAYPFETGGVLLGILGDGYPWIVMAAQVPSAAPARFSYQLPAGATHAAVEKAREMDRRVGYLGDWHSHPLDARASPTDLGTYLNVVRRALFAREQAPLMMVMRLSEAGWEIDLLGRNGILRPTRPMSFLITGPPPEAEASFG